MLGLTQFKSMIYIIGAYSETFYNIMQNIVRNLVFLIKIIP